METLRINQFLSPSVSKSSVPYLDFGRIFVRLLNLFMDSKYLHFRHFSLFLGHSIVQDATKNEFLPEWNNVLRRHWPCKAAPGSAQPKWIWPFPHWAARLALEASTASSRDSCTHSLKKKNKNKRIMIGTVSRKIIPGRTAKAPCRNHLKMIRNFDTVKPDYW